MFRPFERTEIYEGRASPIYLPASAVAQARFVAISPNFGERPRRFDLAGFDGLHAKALTLGCFRETRFGQ